ncbi:MAG: PEGA domain-containing protein [Ignavibacteriales bacterium]|nr:PEGA domain-containing protein [Ignavibacteriales bacterium]
MSSTSRIIAITISFCIFFISCEKSVFTGYEELKPENNKIQITSNPSNAKIYLNGKNTGFTTPSLLTWIESGKDTIGLKLYLFRDTTIIADIKGEAEQKRFIDFKANPGNYGNISCVSSPLGASILLNKSKTYRATPCTFSKVIAGVHSIIISKEGHRADSANVTLAAGETVQANIILEDTSKWVSYMPENSLVKSNLVNSIAIDNNNYAWIGSSDGLSKFDGRNWKVYTSNNSVLRSNVITVLKKDKQNRIWVGTYDGIYLIENNIMSDVSFNLQNQSVVDIAESSNGTIWTALNGGVAKLNGNSWQLFTNSNSGLKDNSPLCIEIDNLDKVWIGSRHYGISILDNNNWSYIPTSSMNIPGIESGVNSICFAEDGTVWVGTITRSLLDFGKLVYRKNNVWYSYNTKENEKDLGSNLARKIVSHKGNIIFATSRGLGIINKSGKFDFFRSGNTKLYELLLRSVAVDKNDNIWLATYSCGAAKLKKGF